MSQTHTGACGGLQGCRHWAAMQLARNNNVWHGPRHAGEMKASVCKATTASVGNVQQRGSTGSMHVTGCLQGSMHQGRGQEKSGVVHNTHAGLRGH